MRIDGKETQVRRPHAGRPGRRAFASGKRRQNTVKTTTISDGHGRTLWSGAQRPGRMHNQTSVHTEGIAEQFHQHPGVRAEVDDGYRGLASESLDQVSAPPKTEGHEGSERRAGHRARRQTTHPAQPQHRAGVRPRHDLLNRPLA
ncbi:transposase family protein [Streptomyces mirabilis]